LFSQSTEPPATSDQLRAIAHLQRQAVIKILAGQDGPTDVSVLALYVAADERGLPLDAISETEREQMHILLHHVLLPRLADADLLRYDYEEGTVAPTANTSDAAELIQYLNW
jgi:hypothetical protein